MPRPRATLWLLTALCFGPALAGCDELVGEAPAEEQAPPPEPPPADALEAALRERGREVAPYMVRSGDPMRGELSEGSARDFSHVFQPGWCYKVVALGEGGIRDLDVRLYDPDSVLLERDTTQDPRPHLGQMRPVCPAKAGTYRIEVRAVRGAGPFAAQVYRSM